ncbi:MAG: nucleotidyltransferase domain-containing protein [Magnetococcales bacterium]|nr:nucleotidyltransferase domain-containing protein [Magnetococcales bacterium]
MTATGLSVEVLNQLCTVFHHVAQIQKVLLFGSRAKGVYRPDSDIDLALVGVGDDLLAELVSEVLDSLPLPYHFDVKAYDSLTYPPLIEHIKRVGVPLYQRDAPTVAPDPDIDRVVIQQLRELGYFSS